MKRFDATEARERTLAEQVHTDVPLETLTDEDSATVDEAIVVIEDTILKNIAKGNLIAKARYKQRGTVFAKPCHIHYCQVMEQSKNYTVTDAAAPVEKRKFTPTLCGLHIKQRLEKRGFNVVLGNTGILISW